MSSMYGRLFTIAFFVSTAASVSPVGAVQDVQIQVMLSSNEIFLGESIDYQVEIRNAENPSPPDLTELEELTEVVENGSQSQNQSQTIIINGRISTNTRLSHVYQYRLTPRKSGELTIPAPIAVIDGKTIRGSEARLRVMNVERQDHVLVEIESSSPKIYPTQPFQITLRILVQPLPDRKEIDPLRPLFRDPPHIQITWEDVPAGLSSIDKSKWLQPLLTKNDSGFTLNELSARTGSFFGTSQAAVFSLPSRRDDRPGLDGANIEYFVYELSREFTAEKAGSYRFGPAMLQGSFVVGKNRNRFETKRIFATSEAAMVEVREVPSPRPSNFSGGIGQYSWSASASPLKLRVGDPLTFSLEVERGPSSGSVELVSAPDLSIVPGLTDDFELIDQSPTGRLEGRTKKFSYALRPKKRLSQIPAIEIASFDPVTEQFISEATAPVTLDIGEADRMASGELIGAVANTKTSEIKSRSEGIFQNISDVQLVADQSIDWRMWSKLLAGIWLSTGVILAIASFRHGHSVDARKKRRLFARRKALARLAEARKAAHSPPDLPRALQLTRESILGLIADTRNMVEDGMTASDVDVVLANEGIDDADRKQMAGILETIEASQYSGRVATNDSASLIAQAESWIARIAPRLERGNE